MCEELLCLGDGEVMKLGEIKQFEMAKYRMKKNLIQERLEKLTPLLLGAAQTQPFCRA